ncbi:hypothetical protein D8Y22_12460 [Salinadaptatus halalkaliphilus]|uniref:Family 2 glycosyl transferase n=1 Tax=Salinadaptatus halalkaliphilus TaxID=2419781 RepID=A0A4S3TK49_9EURY|nr:hypothetical protein [Salinadaptatus halalkaliphilus]THE64451.1 hypothetical protein D8Y22_12460 [Salinadaptatus halalkaliphilus]
MAKPGFFPGEAAITKAEYSRWLRQISEMNANVIRTYTLHPPAFYDALAEHNVDRDDPLLLLQGNWIDEEVMIETGDVFDSAVLETHEEGVENVIDAVHGNLSVPDKPGHASGTFRADVSPYVLGYVLGIEWDPEVVDATDEKHDGLDEYDGTYFTTEDATPFEHWLAARFDDAATYEHEQYDTLRPLSATNWPTTDHLEQPAEPIATEELASVTLNHVLPTDEFTRGLFATYHVYPYYPDFLNHEPEYVDYETETGERSSYRGYLEDLLDASDHPVFIGEFGVPDSRGLTHRHVHGFDQGHHTEREQGEINAALYEQIVEADSLGGAVFAWQDEWFKRVWNTMDYMNPDRRPFWSDTQTCEQSFGLLSFDPKGERSLTLSGTLSEWEGATELYPDASTDPLVRLDDGQDGSRTLTGLEATVDPRYLHLKLSYDDLGSAVDWERTNTVIALDTKPGQGNTTIPYDTEVRTNRGVDFLVHLAGPDDSRVLVDSYYDTFYHHYGEDLEMIPEVGYAGQRDSGEFHEIELALSRALYIPSLEETIEFESYETGKLNFGVGDPEHERYDSLADVCVTPEQNVIELRLPWLLLNFGDPSQREVIGDLWDEEFEMGSFVGALIEGISISAVTFVPDAGGEATDLESATNVTDSLSNIDGDELVFDTSARFEWETWEEPAYEERLKESYDVMQAAFGNVTDDPEYA